MIAYKNSKAKEIQKLLDKNFTVLQVAIKLKTSTQSVYKYIKTHNLQRLDLDNIVDNKTE